MKFFQSEVVQKELTQMQELYMEINKMGLMLNLSQKREQLDKMLRLIELQQDTSSILLKIQCALSQCNRMRIFYLYASAPSGH